MNISVSLQGISRDVSAESLWTHRPKLKNVLATFHGYWFWCYWLHCLMVHSGRRGVKENKAHLPLQTSVASVCTRHLTGRPVDSYGSCQGPMEPWHKDCCCWEEP